MKQITAEEFRQNVKNNPGWAATLNQPTEVIGHVDMSGSRITHLSKFLHFTQPDIHGDCADFSNTSLKVAEGTFDGFVDFSDSRVEQIGELVITQSCKWGNAADFGRCMHLKTARGTFVGSVNFSESGIQKIQADELIITRDKPTPKTCVTFRSCASLKIAEGNFPAGVSFSGSGIEKIGKLIIAKEDPNTASLKLMHCKNLTLEREWLEMLLKHIPGVPGRCNPVIIDAAGLDRAKIKYRAETKAKSLLKSQPEMEI